jgi:periplasmic copper chaperone A
VNRYIAGAAVMLALILPAAAQAHISVHPNTVPAGAYATLNVTVPGEQEGAYVKQLDMLLPPGFTSVDYQVVPGWKVSEVTTKLAKPIQSDDGPINDEVSQIIWTWTGPLGKLENGQFMEFPLSVAIPGNAAGKALEFKTIQTYSNGQVVRWIEPGLDDANPAPRINVTAKGGVLEDVAGDEAGPTAGQGGSTGMAGMAGMATTTAKSSGASKGLAIAALIVGALGLLVGLAALLYVRRVRRPA